MRPAFISAGRGRCFSLGKSVVNKFRDDDARERRRRADASRSALVSVVGRPGRIDRCDWLASCVAVAKLTSARRRRHIFASWRKLRRATRMRSGWALAGARARDKAAHKSERECGRA